MKKNVLKKLLSVLTIFLLLLTALVGCNKNVVPNPQPDVETGKYIATNEYAKVWAAPDTVSIMQDVSIDLQCEYWGDEWLDDADKLYCEGIKGDTEAVQVMITAKKDIASFKFKAGDLISADGTATIDKSNVEVFAERYIEVKAPSSQSKQAAMFSGWYPDALVPIDAYVSTKENKIKSGNNQGIWINVNIPCDAVAGNYIANCTLTLDGIDVNVPIEVKVFDIAMPEENNVKTAFAIWFDQIGKGEIYEDEDGYPIDWDEIYYEFLLSKRITPLTSLTLSSTPSESNYNTLVNEIVRLTRDKRVACFDLPYGQEGHPDYGKVVNKSTMVGLLTAMAEKNMELVDGGENINLFEKAFYYFGSIIDEPSVSKLDAVKYCDLCVTQAKQEVAVLLADYPELQASLLAMQHVITTKVSDAFAGNETEGGVQTWCCEAQNYTKTDLLSIKERQESTERYSQGEGFWIYTTCNSNNPYPSLQLDDNLLSSRVIYWMMNKYDMTGRLFWNVCFYSAYASGQTRSRDIWNDPLSWESANGDGALLYPGTKYGLEVPISTLRLESNRQGIEDCEYLYMFEDALQKYNAKHSTSYDADDILQSFYDCALVKNSTVARTNVKKFGDARTALLELLESVVNDNANASTLLESYKNK